MREKTDSKKKKVQETTENILKYTLPTLLKELPKEISSEKALEEFSKDPGFLAWMKIYTQEKDTLIMDAMERHGLTGLDLMDCRLAVSPNDDIERFSYIEGKEITILIEFKPIEFIKQKNSKRRIIQQKWRMP